MNATPLVDLASQPFEDTVLLTFPHLAAVPGFVHAVTTKPWNMATHCGPQTDRTVERRRKMCDYLDVPFERLTAAEQIHSPHVIRVRETDAGRGREGRETALRFVDGLICDLTDTPVMQFSADCPLIVAVEPRARVFGTAHASWRGTVAGIAAELVRQMQREFGIAAADLLVGIAPCAGPEEYEVGEEVFRIAEARLEDAARYFPRRGGRVYFDLRAANAAQLVAAGVQPANIAVASASTMTDDRFYSHRREGEKAGRFAVVAAFRP